MQKVLVVDDTKNICNLLKTCLEIEGIQVLTVNDGNQALASLKENHFDLIFLDIKLPELSGTEVLRKIRNQGIDTPVVIMTAFATVKNAIECTKLGAVAYLQKPFTAEKIRNTLLEIETNSKNNNAVNFNSYLNSGKDCLQKDNLPEAFKLLKQALAINPDCGEVYSLLAQVYEEQGNHKEAARFNQIAKQFES